MDRTNGLIRGWAIESLSFDSRLQLIYSVIMSRVSFWVLDLHHSSGSDQKGGAIVSKFPMARQRWDNQRCKGEVGRRVLASK